MNSIELVLVFWVSIFFFIIWLNKKQFHKKKLFNPGESITRVASLVD